jgi:hypothetical protein
MQLLQQSIGKSGKKPARTAEKRPAEKKKAATKRKRA